MNTILRYAIEVKNGDLGDNMPWEHVKTGDSSEINFPLFCQRVNEAGREHKACRLIQREYNSQTGILVSEKELALHYAGEWIYCGEKMFPDVLDPHTTTD
jgi:hypothetical protein